LVFGGFGVADFISGVVFYIWRYLWGLTANIFYSLLYAFSPCASPSAVQCQLIPHIIMSFWK